MLATANPNCRNRSVSYRFTLEMLQLTAKHRVASMNTELYGGRCSLKDRGGFNQRKPSNFSKLNGFTVGFGKLV